MFCIIQPKVCAPLTMRCVCPCWTLHGLGSYLLRRLPARCWNVTVEIMCSFSQKCKTVLKPWAWDFEEAPGSRWVEFGHHVFMVFQWTAYKDTLYNLTFEKKTLLDGMVRGAHTFKPIFLNLKTDFCSDYSSRLVLNSTPLADRTLCRMLEICCFFSRTAALKYSRSNSSKKTRSSATSSSIAAETRKHKKQY